MKTYKGRRRHNLDHTQAAMLMAIAVVAAGALMFGSYWPQK